MSMFLLKSGFVEGATLAQWLTCLPAALVTMGFNPSKGSFFFKVDTNSQISSLKWVSENVRRSKSGQHHLPTIYPLFTPGKGVVDVILRSDLQMMSHILLTDDIQVRFVEQNSDGSVKWEAYGNFGPLDVHRQVCENTNLLCFPTCRMYNLETTFEKTGQK